MKRQADRPRSTGPNRLYKRLFKDMSIEERVREVRKRPDAYERNVLVQIAWEYWKYLWERHYRRPCYAAGDPKNKTVVPRDKRNLGLLIDQEGVVELVDRMERCFEVCDELFPCCENGKWKQPITLSAFVNRHFHDKWIRRPTKTAGLNRRPTSTAEKLRALQENDESGCESGGR